MTPDKRISLSRSHGTGNDPLNNDLLNEDPQN